MISYLFSVTKYRLNRYTIYLFINQRWKMYIMQVVFMIKTCDAIFLEKKILLLQKY